MDFKLLGSVLLIVGTSIGAGMLALPIATAQVGFVGSLFLLFGCWIVMTAGALLLLEVNLWLPTNSNLISMARATIGPVGQIIAWITYILLLYSLLCAYISGGSDLFQNILHTRGIEVSETVATIVFTAIFSTIVYLGIRTVDYVNRGLMFVKLFAFIILISLLLPLVSSDNIFAGNIHQIGSTAAIMITITSFGYAAIVPSLRIYFHGDVKKLKKAIFIGSLIPLICYIFWDAAIMGVIPLGGDHGLAAVLTSPNQTGDLVNNLVNVTNKNSVSLFAHVFTSICVLTSFLGVSLCLVDFLADGLKLQKAGPSNVFIHFLTFIPPLIIVLYDPDAFINALVYAGVYCVILLILLPAWMAWQGRYRQNLSNGFVMPGGKTLLIALMLFSVFLIVRSL